MEGRFCVSIMQKYCCTLSVWVSLDIPWACPGRQVLSLNHAEIRLYPVGVGLFGHILRLPRCAGVVAKSYKNTVVSSWVSSDIYLGNRECEDRG